MNIVYIAIPIAMLLGTSLFFGFVWSVKTGQLDDLETPAHRILIDDDKIEMKENT